MEMDGLVGYYTWYLEALKFVEALYQEHIAECGPDTAEHRVEFYNNTSFVLNDEMDDDLQTELSLANKVLIDLYNHHLRAAHEEIIRRATIASQN